MKPKYIFIAMSIGLLTGIFAALGTLQLANWMSLAVFAILILVKSLRINLE